MSEEMLVKYCSPTIMGMKTGNMFSYRFENKAEELDTLRTFNKRLSAKGLRMIPLRRLNDKTLVYLYRPSKLKKDLKDRAAESILSSRGYSCDNADLCLAELMKRLRKNEDFPHEIGLFLGYPPEDVSGFIENHAEGCKCVGCWKVYGDAEKAKNTFDKYKRCTELCCALVANGFKIEQLAAEEV